MTKIFCDVCGEEITGQNHFNTPTEIKTRTKNFVILVTPPKDADICKYCICNAFDNIDDRPRAA